MPMSSSTRPMLPEDRPPKGLMRRLDEGAWLLVPTLSLGSLGFLLGKALAWLLLRFGIAVPALPIWLAVPPAVAGAVFTCWGLVRMRRASQAAALEPVEVLHVTNARCVVSDGDEGASLLFDVGASGSLLVSGDDLRHSSTIRETGSRPVPTGEADATPFGSSFPSSEFVLHRGLESGRLIRIDVLGMPVKPVARVPSFAPLLRGRVRIMDLKPTVVLSLPFDELLAEETSRAHTAGSRSRVPGGQERARTDSARPPR